MAGFSLPKASHPRFDLALVADGLRFPWVTMVFVAGFTIAALLAVRLWLQMGDPSTTDSGVRGFLLSVTAFLVSPYQSQDPEILASPTNGIFEFSTLVALQSYLIATLAIVVTIVAARVTVFVAAQLAMAKAAKARKHPVITLRPAAVPARSRPLVAAGTASRVVIPERRQES